MSGDIVVSLPDGRTVAFPEGTSRDVMNRELDAFWAANQPKTPGAFDEVKRAGSDLLKYGPLGPVAGALERVAPATGADVRAGLENFGTGVARGFSGLLGMPRMVADAPIDIGNWINRRINPNAPQIPTPSQLAGPVADVMAPSREDVQGVMDRVAPPRQAQTMGGRLLQDVGQAIGGAPFAPMMPFNLAAGAGSWGAGELTDQNPIAKALGSLAGVGGAALVQNTAPNAVKMLQRRLSEYTTPQLDAAQALQTQAAGRGVPLMAHEAMDATSAGPMAQLAGTARVQPQGAAITDFAQARVAPGGAIPTAIEDAANTVAPRVANPNEAARNLGSAADAAVKAPKIARVNAAEPFKVQAAPDALDATLKANTLQQIDTALAASNPAGPVAKQLTAFRTQIEASQTVGQMDEALDAFRTIAKSQAFEGSAVPDAVRKVLKPIIQGGYAGLETTSPSYQAFREVYKGTPGSPSPFSVAVAEVEASPAARIAQAQNNPATEGALGAFGNWLRGGDKVPAPSAATVKAEIGRLNKQDPEAARQALRAIIQKDADTAFKALQDGGVPSPAAGVNFMQRTAGTPGTREATIAAIEAVTGNASTARGFDNLLTILQRTGVTPGLNSSTAMRGAMMGEAGQGGVANFALQGANLGRGSALGWLQNWNEMARAGRTWGELADLFAQPDSVAKIRQLALMNPESAKARALAATILQGNQATGARR